VLSDLDTLSSQEIVALIAAEDVRVPAAVAAEGARIAALADVVVERIGRGGRLIYVGAGTSGRLGVLDAAECPPTFGVPPGLVVGLIAGGQSALTVAVEGAEDDREQGARDLAALSVGERDVVLGIAASGSTPYVLGALGAARAAGAFCAALICARPAPLEQAADLTIAPIVGPELVSGSTRMKAGTAQKLALNALSTTVMVRLGKVHGQLMVDVRPTNQKLRARARAIVRDLAGIDEQAAETLLEQSGYQVKPAVVMALGRCDLEQAQRRLAAAGGSLRRALHELSAGAEAT
jgi:N-acetylmuramic acid 6-phosphate etherase